MPPAGLEEGTGLLRRNLITEEIFLNKLPAV
jgi:hypothetical protein